MHIDEFDYHLPQELIAQYPAEKREQSRLMIIRRDSEKIEHRHFYDIVSYLRQGDCLVLNDSKVMPARLLGFKVNAVASSEAKTIGENGCKTGAKSARIEFLLIKRMRGDIWQVMVRPGKKLKIGDEVAFGDHVEGIIRAVICDYGEDGTRLVEFFYTGNFFEILEKIGSMPLPPYIERGNEPEDRKRYQTVYCRHEGSSAAPTAGLHFTDELLSEVRRKGIKTAFVTLHVGIGTFRPVKCENIKDHKMHFEAYSIDEQNAAIINETKQAGGRVICVGTTSARTLESAAICLDGWYVPPGSGDTDIFIYPGYSFKMVDALITNFHLPKSTLMMLVSAFYDREKILEAYDEAINERYRFFSYGDAMFIL